MKQFGFILILFFNVAFATAQTSTEKLIASISNKKFEWMIKKQMDSLASVLDDQLLFIHSNGWAETKKEFIEDINSGKLLYTGIQVQETTVRVFDKTAIVTGWGKFEVILEGNPLALNLAYTEVYILKNKKWLLVSRHANRLP
jgi:hypothetical protein